tara:strand:+ start:957 stop:1139 length:183 start_codon:yes stop_codon:yes gene_type:complete
MIYVELNDKIAKIEILLENRYYSINELINLISSYDDGSDDSTEESNSSDDFIHRIVTDYS